MEHLFRTSPAYDHRGETPNYGQHPVEMHFIVRNEKGALAFSICTGWYIDDMKKAQIGTSGSFRTQPQSQYCKCSFHRPAQLYDLVDDIVHENCGWLNGDQCSAHEPFGGIGKEIGDLMMTFITKPIDEFWNELERHHKEIAK